MTEPVSPELALVDPELARRLRELDDVWVARHAALRVRADRLAALGPASASVEAPPAARARRSVRRRGLAALVLALAALAVTLAAIRLSGTDNRVAGSRIGATARPGAVEARPKPARTVTVRTRPLRPGLLRTTSPPVTKPHPALPRHAVHRPVRSAKRAVRRSKPATPKHAAAPRQRSTKRLPAHSSAAVEREVLALLPGAVRLRRVSSSILDPQTGLIRNGTVIVCTRRPAAVFRCTINAPELQTLIVTVQRGRRDKLLLLNESSG